MVTAVTHDEADIRNEGILAERQAELDTLATKMPKPIPGRPPYLMEKATGIIHPFSDGLAQRSDLVVACYNLQGSMNPADANPDYDPQGITIAEERQRRLRDLPPGNVAEMKASLSDEIAAIRAKMLEEIELERQAMRDDMAVEYESFKKELAAMRGDVTTAKAAKKKDKSKASEKAVSEPETPVTDAAITGTGETFDTALDDALKDS
ncbi:TPA: hypothetical protein ACU6F1_004362 [Escherichia coli]|uniref:hypothetical protein n=1 Tax=Escherichia coli TaxID=562 RepID=UPI0017EED311|nr:hypothetical protein [Escherichia coli]HDQ6808632.1 hypothetical protein [Escherichia coli O22:H16]HDQ6829331.1 hypothetical protein [Escherichia coli O128:H2]EFA1526598.1 hypothetical protein [Escherichia coli]EFG2981123.1 hypothetical protein [Escherichia coli]EFG6327267.1 hypothetical protein [Escherichia coli]